jgi:hypothetical protein
MNRCMNENEADEWETRINWTKFGFRMQTAVRGEAVTRPLIACLYRAFKSSSFFDRVWSSSYGPLGASSGVCRAFPLLPVPNISSASDFLVTVFHAAKEVSRIEALAHLWSGFIWCLRKSLKVRCSTT